MQMLLKGVMVLAQDARNAGLLTKVVAQEQLMEYAIKANNGQYFNLYYSMEEN